MSTSQALAGKGTANGQHSIARTLVLHLTASLLVWSLVLISTTFCPGTPSKNAQRSGKQDSYWCCAEGTA
jgi:hypothetical protein